MEKVLSRSRAILCGLIMAFGASIASYALGAQWAKAAIDTRQSIGELGGYIGFGLLVFVIGIGIIPWLQKRID